MGRTKTEVIEEVRYRICRKKKETKESGSA